MAIWTRVFSRDEVPPDEGMLSRFLAGLGAAARFEADERGWFRAEADAGLVVERYGADEEGVRAELNAWAAYLETCDWSPHHGPLMERMIQSRQVFTIRKALDHADEPRADRVCRAMAMELARLTGGFWQADGVGFLDEAGTVLVPEY
ncbi:MAG: hypothetical protein K2W96_16785 [Gemmataceae bacterium]|nr:hypothetical protein [Gemmataceae bacterium]